MIVFESWHWHCRGLKYGWQTNFWRLFQNIKGVLLPYINICTETLVNIFIMEWKPMNVEHPHIFGWALLPKCFI